MTGITILVVVLVAASVVGVVLTSRAGKVRHAATEGTSPLLTAMLTDAGAVSGHATVLHFSADWCGPCSAVRRVVGQVLTELDGPTELELDIDEHQALARELGVLSLPTTFVLDWQLNQRVRIAGVPKAAALKAALLDL
ncbi:thioredoxin family protein [Rhodococcus sp. H29-C3]|uniref:thioredoxin family protein n=1 Tax=Rhodococcus sp. H29-C3 TaxID=3046307 RepID=UPI0024BAD266|nr:thioredoxin family protein [Rhodococcus sp. H29-C3]MDJ0360222.1 thioredoxin family protein [Rhodococcus sp. H29-C3]